MGRFDGGGPALEQRDRTSWRERTPVVTRGKTHRGLVRESYLTYRLKKWILWWFSHQHFSTW